MLKVENINQFYKESHTLRDLSIECEAGKRVCVMGRNGVGKTTLCKAIMGLLPIRGGKIIFDGINIAEKPATARAEMGIGYVPQGREIFSSLTVKENLEIGVLSNRNKIKKPPEKIYDLFPALRDSLNRKGGDLSGGQQQQLAIARALCLDPKLIILDEPSEGIQPNITARVGDAIDYLANVEKIAVLLIEQKLPFARKHGDNFYILNRGSVAAGGAMSELGESIVETYLNV